MVVSIKVRGLANTSRFLATKSIKAKAIANAAVAKAGFFVEKEVVQSITGNRAEPESVDTGNFRRSVKSVQNTPLTATIASNVSYAKFLEWGSSRMKPRRHFTNTAARNRIKIAVFIEAALKKL